MAKRKGRRRFNLRKVRIHANAAAGALASEDVAVAAITNASVDPYRLMSIDVAWAWQEIGGSADDGMSFGVAHSDYTAAEVEECLEAIGAIDRGNKVAQEQSNRLVREIGTIQSTISGTVGTTVNMNEGLPVKTKLNWYMSIGDQLNVYMRNSSGTVWTTGSSISADGVIWIKDSV